MFRQRASCHESGLASCERLVVRHESDVPTLEGSSLALLKPQLRQVCEFTRCLARKAPIVQVEWALEKGDLYFVDVSICRDEIPVLPAEPTLLSAGAACGPALVLPEEALLEPLSLGAAVSIREPSVACDHRVLRELVSLVAKTERKPIVFAQRPYAILAILVDRVAGFIFTQGGVLCHLAVILRERGCPAVIAEVDVANGDEVLINDGEIVVQPQVPGSPGDSG